MEGFSHCFLELCNFALQSKGLRSITKFPATVITHIAAKVLLSKSVRRIISLTLGEPHACLLLNQRDIKGEETRVIGSIVINHRL